MLRRKRIKRKYIPLKKLKIYRFLLRKIIKRINPIDRIKYYKILGMIIKRLRLHKRKLRRIKNKLRRLKAIVNIKTSFNNTFINVVTPKGKTVLTVSAGLSKFKHKRAEKGTPLAAKKIANFVGNKLKTKKIKNIGINLTGPSKKAKILALKALKKRNLRILYLQDKAKLPHGGCRPPKRLRK